MGAPEPHENIASTSTNEQEKPLVFHDPWVYRLAIGGIGAALVAFLICGGIIGATNHAGAMVKEYWTIGAALSGALVGIIAPSPRQKKESAHSLAASDNVITKTEKAGISLAAIYQPLLLLVALGVSLWLTSELDASNAAVVRTLAAGSAGALVGLLVPSPGTNLKP